MTEMGKSKTMARSCDGSFRGTYIEVFSDPDRAGGADHCAGHVYGPRAWRQQDQSRLGDFRHLTWSCELGISKPDSAIYWHTLEKLGVSAEEALFIDDLQENVRAAEALGLQAILFTTPAQLQIDLELSGFATQLPPVTSGH